MLKKTQQSYLKKVMSSTNTQLRVLFINKILVFVRAWNLRFISLALKSFSFFFFVYKIYVSFSPCPRCPFLAHPSKVKSSSERETMLIYTFVERLFGFIRLRESRVARGERFTTACAALCSKAWFGRLIDELSARISEASSACSKTFFPISTHVDLFNDAARLDLTCLESHQLAQIEPKKSMKLGGRESHNKTRILNQSRWDARDYF